MNKEFLIYTDGACIGNGKSRNIGGWGYCIIREGKLIHQEVKIEFNTTNNRQELSGVINALTYCQENNLGYFTILSDSQYVVKGFNEWMLNWRKKGWVKGLDKKPIPNDDLWKKLWWLKELLKPVFLVWVRGHNGDKWNEYADKLIEVEMAKHGSYAF